MATIINRAIYSNVGGAQNQVVTLYNNINGTQKTMSAAYANISGSQVQIFPYDATTIYTWNKYDIARLSADSPYDDYRRYSEVVYKVESYEVVSSSTSSTGYGLTITSGEAVKLNSGITSLDFYWTYNQNPINTLHMFKGGTVSYNSSYTDMDTDYWLVSGIQWYYPRGTGRGSLIATYSSQDPNEYPVGISGGYYWIRS